MAVVRRYQVSSDAAWGPLIAQARRARRALRRALTDSNVASPIRWRQQGKPWQSSGSIRKAARAIVADADGHKRSVRYNIAGALSFRLLVGAVEIPGNIPSAALKTRATKRTLAFHEEMQLVFPAWKTLGLYVARPIKADIPAGWTVGDPWPPGAYASEHPWAAADDTGMKDDTNPGAYETAIAVLFPFLQEVTDYVLANFRRLKVIEHIFDGRTYYAVSSSEKGYAVRPYGGSDDHRTHTHTAFGDHLGIRPPWVPA